eukprot:gene23737-9293_t
MHMSNHSHHSAKGRGLLTLLCVGLAVLGMFISEHYLNGISLRRRDEQFSQLKTTVLMQETEISKLSKQLKSKLADMTTDFSEKSATEKSSARESSLNLKFQGLATALDETKEESKGILTELDRITDLESSAKKLQKSLEERSWKSRSRR